MAVKRRLHFRATSGWGQILAKWHESLEEDRGERSALRSSTSPLDVVFVPAYHRLFRDLADHAKLAIEQGKIDQDWRDVRSLLLDRLPIIAGLVSLIKWIPRVDEAVGRESYTVARKMGQPRPGDERPRLSGLRFRRLLKCREPEALYTGLRRAIRMLQKGVDKKEADEKEADIYLLVDDVFYWSEERRKQWAYDYYAAAPPKTE